MNQIRYAISPYVFEKAPGYMRGVVVITNIDNTRGAGVSLELLRAAEAAMRSSLTLDSFLALPQVTAWREAIRSTGANPSEFRAAHEAMGRRVLQGKDLPDINPAVNIGNVLSLRHRIPVGIHPLDNVKLGLDLRASQANDSFIPFGSDKQEAPRGGEIVLAEGNEIVCRCWVWRQARNSVTLPGTRTIVVNIDGLPPISESEVMSICAEAKELICSACGGSSQIRLLSAAIPSTSITV